MAQHQKLRLFGVDILVPNSDHQIEPIYNPSPLRFCPPIVINPKKRKLNDPGMRGRRRVAEDQNPDPLIPQELLLKLGGTTEPVFLYQKKLENSDLRKSHNRLFVNRRARLDMFLNDEERKILNDPTNKGLENVVGLDAGGSSYELGLNVWQSLDVLVIKDGWSQLVKAHDARRGDWVQIWGYRKMEKLCLAINFDKA